MKYNLTEKQKQTYDAIESHIKRKGYAPTYAELKDALGVKSSSMINARIARLKELGWIDYIPAKARSITIK